MKEQREQFEWDSATAAFHELGHSIVQVAFDIGPAELRIQPCDRGWEGFSGPFAHVDPDGVFEFLDASRLGGPIAQLMFRPESLREFWEGLSQSILENCAMLLADNNNSLCQLGWENDLSKASKILERAKYGLSERQDQSLLWLEAKNYLFASERALRSFFRTTKVQEVMMVMANKLAHDRQLDVGIFRDEIHSRIPANTVEMLTSIDFPHNTN